jgi:endonuclease G
MPLSKLPAILAALAVSLSAQHRRFGLPACPPQHQEFADRSFFLLCHDPAAKTPAWVGYELKPEHLVRSAPRPSHFRPDRLLSHPGASDRDYRNSGFSRGHLAPATDFSWSPAAIRSTFLLSNAVPQRQSVNAAQWAHLERAVRAVAARSDAVYIFTGPVFPETPERIGPGGVAVPSHTFKAVLAVRGQNKVMYAAIVPNADNLTQPLARFLTTVDEVERLTGLDFFDALDDSTERTLEAAPPPSISGIPALSPP